MVLVPDLATDLGTHNDNYTKWTFTIRHGVKWGENGQPVTAKEVAFGMTRCMDAATFPTGACPYYANAYYKGGADYKGVYTDPGTTFTAIKVNGNTITINDGPAVPGHAVLGHRSRPTARSRWTRRSRTRRPTRSTRWSTGPYMIKYFSLVQGAGPGEEPVLGPRDRPGSHAVPRRVRLQAADSRRRRPTRSCWPTPATGQTTLTYDDLLAPDYQQMQQKAPEPADPGWLAVHLLLGSGQPEDHRQEGARGSVVGLPLQERDPRCGSDPERQRDPGHEPDASGSARSHGRTT